MEEKKQIKNHISKLTNALTMSEHGKFPSQAQPNPSELHVVQTSDPNRQDLKEANAITTRYGKVIDATPKNRNTRESSSTRELDESKDSEAVVSPARVPFPEALKSTLKAIDHRLKF